MNFLHLRVEEHINHLATFTSTPGHGVTRLVYSEEDRQAKSYIKQEMRKLGLDVEEDEIGNIMGIWHGKNPELPQVWTGSHVDAPLHGGKYDGVVGVIGGLEAIRILKERGVQPKCDVVLAVFSSEEPTRFGVGCLGSRALTGMIREEDLDRWCDDHGQSLRQVLESNGKQPEKVLRQQINPAKVKQFIELHIEQGDVLENKGIPIGIVDRIAAPSEIQLTIWGEQRHAGSTPMDLRKDPMPAAAEVILLVERLNTSGISSSSVGTVGKLHVTPGASNVIPGMVELTVDIRDVDKAKKDELIMELEKSVNDICERRDLSWKWKINGNDSPAVMDVETLHVIKQCAKELNYPYLLMPSGAYHDAMILSRKVPSNMIFVPSQDGISHAPEEFTSTFYIVKGIELLALTLQKITA
ncbi:M20 family metallo-hydrolase [Brevibacillus sp. H7]|uniref:M20 family metallo-hydrolase n=1 Tax=Brevibacillus sp. H7 TaxID=3349138 RepID=UPI00381C178B